MLCRQLKTKGPTQRHAYDLAGNAIRVTSADNFATDLYYDELNRVVRASDEAGNAVTKSLDLNGRVRLLVDPNGNAVNYDYYDGLKNGWVKRVTQPKVQSYTLHGEATILCAPHVLEKATASRNRRFKSETSLK